jgi:multiple sugar transport system substrate-binding protein
MLDEINQKVVKYINTVVAPKSSPVNPPSPNAANEASRLLGSLREQVCYGKITAEQAAPQFFTEANKILAK